MKGGGNTYNSKVSKPSAFPRFQNLKPPRHNFLLEELEEYIYICHSLRNADHQTKFLSMGLSNSNISHIIMHPISKPIELNSYLLHCILILHFLHFILYMWHVPFLSFHFLYLVFHLLPSFWDTQNPLAFPVSVNS